MITILIFIAVLGLLVFVHELGHFLVAKRSGMQVDEFGFGFPPRVIGFYTGPNGKKVVFGPKTPPDALGTVYSINAIPLGGFVKIVGENNDEPDNPNSFSKKSFFARLATLLAGVTMNVVLAWVLLTIVLFVGVPTVFDAETTLPAGAQMTTPKVTIVEVKPESPAARAGLQIGDVVVKLDEAGVTSVREIQEYILPRKGSTIQFSIERGDAPLQIAVASLAEPPAGEGPTGIALGTVGKLSYPWYKAPVVALSFTGSQLWAIVEGLGQMVSGGVELSQVGGPVKIAQLTGQASRLGFVYLLQFAAFLSLNLAVLNALPIPALDGGRVLFLLIEKIRRKPNNPQLEQTVNVVGFLALLLLMVVVTVNDFNGFSFIGKLFK